MNKLEKEKGFNLFVLLIGIVLLAIAVLMSISNTFDTPALQSTYDVPLEGYKELSISIIPPDQVMMEADCFQLKATTSQEQAESINRAIQGEDAKRPNSHDLTELILEEYSIDLLAVKINEIKDQSYISDLILKKDDKVLNLDSKPSDAVAIALRTQSHIYIKEDLLKEHGRRVC